MKNAENAPESITALSVIVQFSAFPVPDNSRPPAAFEAVFRCTIQASAREFPITARPPPIIARFRVIKQFLTIELFACTPAPIVIPSEYPFVIVKPSSMQFRTRLNSCRRPRPFTRVCLYPLTLLIVTISFEGEIVRAG